MPGGSRATLGQDRKKYDARPPGSRAQNRVGGDKAEGIPRFVDRQLPVRLIGSVAIRSRSAASRDRQVALEKASE